MAYRALSKQTIMLWAGMRADGRIVWCFTSDFYDNERNMNSAVYTRILREFLLQIYEPGQFWIQDNSRVHTAHLIRDYLMEMGVWSLPHPPRSPDLNPIEHFWMRLKEAVHRLHTELISMQGGHDKLIAAMRQAVRDAMAEIEAIGLYDFPAKCIESMPRRFEALMYTISRGSHRAYFEHFIAIKLTMISLS